MFAVSLLATVLLDDKPQPPPLTEKQRTEIQALVRAIQSEMTAIRSRLEQAQKELARHYAEFDLDVAAVDKLEADIIDLQKRQLASYRKLHVELRKIVGRERFAVLRQRIDNVLNPPTK